MKVWTRGDKSLWIKASPRVARFVRRLPGKIVTATRDQPPYRTRVIVNSKTLTKLVKAVRALR